MDVEGLKFVVGVVGVFVILVMLMLLIYNMFLFLGRFMKLICIVELFMYGVRLIVFVFYCLDVGVKDDDVVFVVVSVVFVL